MTDDLSFKPYADAHDNFCKDAEQIIAISNRLIASAEGVESEPIKATAKLGKLNSISAQMDKLRQARADARNRYDAAIDAADATRVNQLEGICSYAMATGQGDAGTQYLLEECKSYARAKGDFQVRKALFGQIIDISAAVASALDGKKQSSSGSSIIDEFESITDPEARTRFHNKHRDQLLAAHDARNQNTQSETQNASN